MTIQIKLDLVIDNLSFPTSLTFDNRGIAYLAESGLSFDNARRTNKNKNNITGGRILKVLEKDSNKDKNNLHETKVLAQGFRSPINGLTFYDNFLYVSEGGYPGRISRLSMDGNYKTILDNLPGFGNYHTNMVAFGQDNKLYFSQGAMTNSGIIGLDSYELYWLRQISHSHDIPGYDIVLNGINIETLNPLGDKSQTIHTGAFVPFGTVTNPGQRVSAKLPCTAAIIRCNPNDGSDLELVAWGLRNSFGLGFLPDGRLFAIDQGYDDRGSRPVGNAPDLLYEIHKDAWYGWPDFIGGIPICNEAYKPKRGGQPQFLLANHNELPPPEQPILRFPANSAATKFDIMSSEGHIWNKNLFVALFGDEKPMTSPTRERVGRSIVRINPTDWSMHHFISEPLVRPIDVRFNPVDNNLYILDFGQFEIDSMRKVISNPTSGRLWKVTKE